MLDSKTVKAMADTARMVDKEARGVALIIEDRSPQEIAALLGAALAYALSEDTDEDFDNALSFASLTAQAARTFTKTDRTDEEETTHA